MEMALIENVAREQLNPVDEARACATLVEDLGLTKEELGKPPRTQPRGALEPHPHPRPARRSTRAPRGRSALGGPRPRDPDRQVRDERSQLARDAASGGWSVRETERARERWRHCPPKASRRPGRRRRRRATPRRGRLESALGRGVRVSAVGKKGAIQGRASLRRHGRPARLRRRPRRRLRALTGPDVGVRDFEQVACRVAEVERAALASPFVVVLDLDAGLLKASPRIFVVVGRRKEARVAGSGAAVLGDRIDRSAPEALRSKSKRTPAPRRKAVPVPQSATSVSPSVSR